MTRASSTLYYDVTQLIHWPGKITGIPRVIEELAIRFRREESDIVFVAWVKELGALCEIDYDKTQRGKHIEYLRGDATVNYEKIAEADKVAMRQEKTLPPSMLLKKGAIKITKKGLGVVSKFRPGLAAQLESTAQLKRMQHYKRAQFQKGDRLFIGWGEWNDESFMSMLESAHAHGVRLVQVQYDMSPAVVPQFSNSGNATVTFPIYCRRILPICDLVLSISENTTKDAVKWLKDQKLHVPPIKFFRLGDDIEVANPTKVTDPAYTESGLKGNDFLLCVGTFELKKNHMLFYYVYKMALEKGIELPKLVMVGRRGWMTEATYELMTKDPTVKDKFVFLHNASDEELSWIFDRALFSVLPSFYEGWGVPIAESIARGVPCLSSGTSSMSEVAPGFVEHFSPTSADECLAAIQRYLQPKTLAAAREKVKKYKQFSWDESFAQVLSHMKEIK